jgi:hypothetical protein
VVGHVSFEYGKVLITPCGNLSCWRKLGVHSVDQHCGIKAFCYRLRRGELCHRNPIREFEKMAKKWLRYLSVDFR